MIEGADKGSDEGSAGVQWAWFDLESLPSKDAVMIS